MRASQLFCALAGFTCPDCPLYFFKIHCNIVFVYRLNSGPICSISKSNPSNCPGQSLTVPGG